MKILVLNASPKGKNSTTVHTALYLQALHPEHTFTVLPVGQRIKSYEKDFSPLRAELEQADLLLFCYPVYTFIAPYQLHRLIELIKADGVDLSGKFASQITTSKHFYDVTAHRYVEENCFDLGMKVVRGLSADMDDLLTQQGQQEARNFFDQLMFSCEHGLFVTPPARAPQREKSVYQPVLPSVSKSKAKDVVIVTNCAPEDENLQNMIADFRAALPFESRVVNLREFPFAGGCLGCFGCAITGKCVYKDGFDEFLRSTIQTADAFVYAFTISDHYTHSSFKCYDDRQFCNGHRTVTHGTPIAYLISGDYQYESNLRMIVEGRSEVGGNYLCRCGHRRGKHHSRHPYPGGFPGICPGEEAVPSGQFLRRGRHEDLPGPHLCHAGHDEGRPQVLQGAWHLRFSPEAEKAHLQMKLVGAMLAVPSVQKKMKGQMNQYIIGPYQKVVEQAREVRQ